MYKTLLLVSAFVAALPMLSQTADSGALAPVGLTSGETLRVTVSSPAPGPCVAQLGFLDSRGQPIGTSSGISLTAGESTFLDLPLSSISARPGERVEIRPRLVSGVSANPSGCQISVSVLHDPAEPMAREVKEARPADGPHEGIHVHGYWTMDLRNPDGTLIAHREFENSLTSSGAHLLTSLFNSTITFNSWIVVLNDASHAAPCPNNIYTSVCTFAPSNSFFTLTLGLFPGPLAVSAPASGLYQGDTVLSASYTFLTSGSITDVATYWLYNPSPYSLSTSSVGSFTGTTIQSLVAGQLVNSPISVVAGQTLQITVAIGFM